MVLYFRQFEAAVTLGQVFNSNGVVGDGDGERPYLDLVRSGSVAGCLNTLADTRKSGSDDAPLRVKGTLLIIASTVLQKISGLETGCKRLVVCR